MQHHELELKSAADVDRGTVTPERAPKTLREEAEMYSPGGTGKMGPETPSTSASTRARSHSPQRKRTLAQSPSVRKLFPIPKPSGHSVNNLSTYRNSPRYTFQPPARDMSGLNVPGPGSYTHDGRPVGSRPAAHMLTRKKDRSPMRAPGPEAYDSKTYVGEGHKYSLGMANCERPSMGPGPGSYNSRSMGNGLHYSVGNIRAGPMNNFPGPGTYDHGRHGIHPHSAQHTMNGPRFPKDSFETRPGPESYTHATSIGKGHAFSHGSPRRDGARAHSPGPGHYGGLYTTFHLH